MIVIRLAGQFRKLVEGKPEVELIAGDVFECINNLDNNYPGVKARLYDDNGEVREHVDIYLNGDNIRSLDGLSTPLKHGDEIDILSAFAAG
mgnify:CR=1 FL=1